MKSMYKKILICKGRCLLFLTLMLLFVISATYSQQSVIVESEGYSCMGEEKSRKQTKQDAVIDAERKAMEYTLTHIKSETKVKDFQLVEDILDVYSQAKIKILHVDELGWYKDRYSGDCFKVKIQAEVIPNKKEMENLWHQDSIKNNPLTPLKVRVWTDKKEYRKKEKIKIYIEGSKPFYGRVICKEDKGEVIQLLPNPYRGDCYFNGGVIYEIPSAEDRFELEVTPPFGMDTIILYGSTAKLGKINLQTAGALYAVDTEFEAIGLKTRGVTIKQKKGEQKVPAEFSEATTVFRTVKDR